MIKSMFIPKLTDTKKKDVGGSVNGNTIVLPSANKMTLIAIITIVPVVVLAVAYVSASGLGY